MYITYGELFSFVIMIVAVLTYIENRNHKHKK